MAAGKSSVAQALAEHFDRSIHLHGDVFRRMVVSGRVEMSAEPSEEALRQLLLRYEAAREAAAIYHGAGFNVVYQDTIVGPLLSDVLNMYKALPIHVVVLCPTEAAIQQRERDRRKKGYTRMTIQQMQRAVSQTPKVGLWIDNSDQTIWQTAEEILNDLPAARVLNVG